MGGWDFGSRRDAEARRIGDFISRRGEMHPSRKRPGRLSEANPEGAARGCERQRAQRVFWSCDFAQGTAEITPFHFSAFETNH